MIILIKCLILSHFVLLGVIGYLIWCRRYWKDLCHVRDQELAVVQQRDWDGEQLYEAERKTTEKLRQELQKWERAAVPILQHDLDRLKEPPQEPTPAQDTTRDQVVLQQVLDLLEDEDFDEGDAVIATVAIRRHLGLD